MRDQKRHQSMVESAVDSTISQMSLPTYGIVLNYDQVYNTADIIIADQGSDNFGDKYSDVPCPMISGIQTVSPQKGTPCVVIFKDNKGTYPVITNFFNHLYNEFSYNEHYKAVNPLPRFMMDL